MSLPTIVIILATTLLTSFISGIFALTGGIIFMGVLVAIVSVPMAMIIHGSIQLFANGYRAWLHRGAIAWGVFQYYLIGAAIGVSLLVWVSWTPDKQAVYLLLGLITFTIWVPKDQLDLDIRRPRQAVLVGVAAQGMNTLAGVGGPILDLFMVRTDMTRQEIVATKSATQCLSHIIKVGFWTVPVVSAAGWGALPPIWIILAAIPISMAGTRLGAMVLDRMNDHLFKRWMKWLVTAVGLFMLARAGGLY